MSRQTRRTFLATAGALGVAGCMSSDPPSDGSGSENRTPAGGETTTSTTEETITPGETTTAESGGGLPGSQFDGFEDLERWYVLNQRGSLSASKKPSYEGSQSMRLKSGGKYAGAFKAFSSPQDMSGKNLSLAVRVNSPRGWKLSVELLAPDRGNKLVMTRTMPGPVNTWMRMDMGATREVRNPDLSSVQEIRIIARGGDDQPIELFVDDLRLVERPETGYVMLTFDDAWRSHYTTAFPMMQERGFAGVEGVVSDVVYGESRLDIGMMREMRDAGWDMASRPASAEYLTQLSPKKQRQKIERNKQFLVRKGFQEGARHFLTPGRRRGPKTMEIVKEFHDTMFTFGGSPNGLPSTTLYNYGRINADNSAPIGDLIDLAAKHKQLLVCNTGAIGNEDDDWITERDFKAFLDYVKKANVEVITASDLLKMQQG